MKHRKTTFRSYVQKPWFNHALVGFNFRSSGDQTNYNPELCLTNRGGYSWLYDNDLCEFGSKMLVKGGLSVGGKDVNARQSALETKDS